MSTLTTRRAWLGFPLALLCGCGRNALRTPTPAAALDTRSLDHAAPGESFFALVFSSQSVPKRPARAHTWATVVRSVSRPAGPPAVDEHTISWLPATLDVRPLDFSVEPGVNLGLHETLLYAIDNRERVSLWGPYQTRPSLFRRFLVQKAFLDSGQVGYQASDEVGEAARTGTGCNCIHAITDMDPVYGRESYPLLWFGDAASEHLANRLHKGGALIAPDADHDWLLAALGLRAYRIVRRRYGDRLIDFPRVPPGSRRRPLRPPAPPSQ